MGSTSCRAARVRVGRTGPCVRSEKECPLCGRSEERGRVCPGEGRASCGERENRAVCALGKATPVRRAGNRPVRALGKAVPVRRAGNRPVCALGKATPVRRTGKKRHLGKHPARKAGKSAVPKRKAGARDGHGMICLYRSPFGRKHRCTGWIRAGAVPWDRDFWLAPLLPGFHRVALPRAGRRHTRL